MRICYFTNQGRPVLRKADGFKYLGLKVVKHIKHYEQSLIAIPAKSYYENIWTLDITDGKYTNIVEYLRVEYKIERKIEQSGFEATDGQYLVLSDKLLTAISKAVKEKYDYSAPRIIWHNRAEN